jgi:hypothetical protein
VAYARDHDKIREIHDHCLAGFGVHADDHIAEAFRSFFLLCDRRVCFSGRICNIIPLLQFVKSGMPKQGAAAIIVRRFPAKPTRQPLSTQQASVP